jgi:hypothetical protein
MCDVMMWYTYAEAFFFDEAFIIILLVYTLYLLVIST